MIICGIIIFIFSLLFNEVIILNFFGLDFNTNKRIKERENSEIENLFEMCGTSLKDDIENTSEND